MLVNELFSLNVENKESLLHETVTRANDILKKPNFQVNELCVYYLEKRYLFSPSNSSAFLFLKHLSKALI